MVLGQVKNIITFRVPGLLESGKCVCLWNYLACIRTHIWEFVNGLTSLNCPVSLQ